MAENTTYAGSHEQKAAAGRQEPAERQASTGRQASAEGHVPAGRRVSAGRQATSGRQAPAGRKPPTKRYAPYRGRRIQGPRCVIRQDDPQYPDALRRVRHPPASLYVIGDPLALQEGLAVIGARKATPYGKGLCRRFAGAAARRGLVIISGGAYGCDAEAHRAALDAGGKTVVFFGGGCDHVYPARHLPLFQQVVDAGGAIVSEHEWEFPPQPYTFRERNRLIAGLARATLIVEAGLPSGTFSTADDALSVGREVLVVPGPITSPTSAGTNRLLLQGALPIIDDDSFDDALLSVFGLLKYPGAVAGMPYADDPLLAALLANPMRLEEMTAVPGICGATSRFDALTEVTVRLARLEGQGLIVRYPDGRYGPKGDIRLQRSRAARTTKRGGTQSGAPERKRAGDAVAGSDEEDAHAKGGAFGEGS